MICSKTRPIFVTFALTRPPDALAMISEFFRDVLMTEKKVFFDFDENDGKCEIYLSLSRNGLPNRENLLMCEHLKTCAKEPISLTFFLDHHNHT